MYKYFLRASFATLDFKYRSLAITASLESILGSSILIHLFSPGFSNNQIIKVVREVHFASVTSVIFGCFRSQNSTWICRS